MEIISVTLNSTEYSHYYQLKPLLVFPKVVDIVALITLKAPESGIEPWQYTCIKEHKLIATHWRPAFSPNTLTSP